MTTGYYNDALHDLIPFVQFKKREIHPWRGDLFVKLQALSYNFTKSTTPPRVFFTFFKLDKWYKITHSVSYIILRSQFPINSTTKMPSVVPAKGVFLLVELQVRKL